MGLAAGSVDLSLGVIRGATLPGAVMPGVAAMPGSVGYGASLAPCTVAQRRPGTARTAAYFKVGPFVGAALAVAEPLSLRPGAAAAPIAFGTRRRLPEEHGHAGDR